MATGWAERLYSDFGEGPFQHFSAASDAAAFPAPYRWPAAEIDASGRVWAEEGDARRLLKPLGPAHSSDPGAYEEPPRYRPDPRDDVAQLRAETLGTYAENPWLRRHKGQGGYATFPPTHATFPPHQLHGPPPIDPHSRFWGHVEEKLEARWEPRVEGDWAAMPLQQSPPYGWREPPLVMGSYDVRTLTRESAPWPQARSGRGPWRSGQHDAWSTPAQVPVALVGHPNPNPVRGRPKRGVPAATTPLSTLAGVGPSPGAVTAAKRIRMAAAPRTPQSLPDAPVPTAEAATSVLCTPLQAPRLIVNDADEATATPQPHKRLLVAQVFTVAPSGRAAQPTPTPAPPQQQQQQQQAPVPAAKRPRTVSAVRTIPKPAGLAAGAAAAAALAKRPPVIPACIAAVKSMKSPRVSAPVGLPAPSSVSAYSIKLPSAPNPMLKPLVSACVAHGSTFKAVLPRVGPAPPVARLKPPARLAAPAPVKCATPLDTMMPAIRAVNAPVAVAGEASDEEMERAVELEMFGPCTS